MSEEEVVQLVFPESERELEEEPRKIFSLAEERGIRKSRIFDVEEILNWFKKLEVKQIELTVQTTVKTGKVVNLFVSAEGKGGVKVILVPKSNE